MKENKITIREQEAGNSNWHVGTREIKAESIVLSTTKYKPSPQLVIVVLMDCLLHKSDKHFIVPLHIVNYSTKGSISKLGLYTPRIIKGL